jgi:hypothetical protein
MANILKLPDVWRTIRELDLESIRRDAEGRFRIVVYPQVADKRSGFASITVEHAKRKLTLDWPWGEGALKTP